MGAEVDVDGSQNRAAGRDYIELNLASVGQTGKLVRAQRTHLGGLVAEINDQFGVRSADIWTRVIHASLGVNSVDEIQRHQFEDAVAALQEYRRHCLEQKRREGLREEVRALLKGEHVTDECRRYCLREFGDDDLYELPSDKLRQLLVHLEMFIASDTHEKRISRLSFAQLVSTYPLACSVMVGAGFFVGFLF